MRVCIGLHSQDRHVCQRKDGLWVRFVRHDAGEAPPSEEARDMYCHCRTDTPGFAVGEDDILVLSDTQRHMFFHTLVILEVDDLRRRWECWCVAI